MSYVPFCSIEVAFGNMQPLHDLINNCSADKKPLVLCDRFTTDLWGITADIGANVAAGVDALSHAIEPFWAKPTTYLVKDAALRAIDMIMTYLPQVLADPQNIAKRTAMCRASLLAGLAFAKTRTTACHPMGYAAPCSLVWSTVWPAP